MKKLALQTVDGGTLELSKIIIGTAQLHQIWRNLGEEGTFEYFDAYRRMGGDTIDTGRAYGGEADQISFGLAESVISRYMKSRHCEDSLHIITKGGFPDLDVTNLSHMTRFRITREAILGDFYTSYDRLQKGPIDVYMLHRDDPEKPVSYIMDILQEIADTGLVRVIGVSNWSLARVLEANEYARKNGQVEIAANEIMWSYADTNLEARNDPTLSVMNAELYQAYLANPIPLVAFSSQARGLFSQLYKGAYSWADVAKENPWYNLPENEKRWEKIKAYCDRTGASPAAVTLSYLTSNPLETAAIVGCMTAAEVEDSMADADLVLSEEDLRWFDEI